MMEVFANQYHKKAIQIIPFAILLSLSLLAFACISSENVATYGDECSIDEECEEGLYCIDNICQNKADGDSTESDSDVLTCEEDWHCPIDFVCEDGICIEQIHCQSDNDCKVGQVCKDGICTGEVIVDGDDDDDFDSDETVDGDTEQPVDGDLDQTCDDPCNTSAECALGLVCDSNGCCGDPCTENSCPEGMVCNEQNGYCEYCDETCSTDQCCNLMPGAFWYCGNCCTPPCAEGYACQYGECEPLECPDCPVGAYCGPETKYLCYTPPVDGDTDDPWWPDGDFDEETGELDSLWKSACLPANSSCVDGIDECCSGTCLMGTCL